jgi:dihydropteroate synthase
MEKIFWKELLRIYLEGQDNIPEELNKLRRNILASSEEEVNKDRMVDIIEEILDSEDTVESLLQHTAEEVARFTGRLCEL